MKTEIKSPKRFNLQIEAFNSHRIIVQNSTGQKNINPWAYAHGTCVPFQNFAFAKFWDLYANSGEFKNFIMWLKESSEASPRASYFYQFFEFSEYLSSNFSDTHSLSLISLAKEAWSFMILCGLTESESNEIILKDYCFGNKRRDVPVFIKNQTVSKLSSEPVLDKSLNSFNVRQLKHLN